MIGQLLSSVIPFQLSLQVEMSSLAPKQVREFDTNQVSLNLKTNPRQVPERLLPTSFLYCLA